MKKILFSVFLITSSLVTGLAQLNPATNYQGGVSPANTHSHTTPNGNSSLGLSYVQQNVCGLNYVQASAMTSTRYTTCPCTYTPGTGFPTTLTIAGLPTTCMTVQKAFLYWMASYTEAVPPATTANFTNPIPSTSVVPGSIVGTSVTDNWGEVGTATYRADVTADISGNGNYTVNLNGFANENWEIDGVTLIIIYTSPVAYSGSIVIYDGCSTDNIGTSQTFTLSGFTVCGNSAVASAFGAFGDCQSNLNGNQNTDTFNGSTATFGNNFWNFNIIPTTVTAGQTTSVFQAYTNCCCDAWNWNIAGLYWQNTNCITCSAGAITLSSTQVNPTCGNTNGTITVTAAGGSPPYTYTWTPAVSTSATATGLSAGTYTITVKDGACNTATINVTLTTTASFALTANATANVLCNGSATGSASSTPVGGTLPYTYSWSTIPVQTNQNATGLSAGTYTVTVMDNTGCTSTASVTITQPPALTLTASNTPVLCAGGATGTASALCGGGTAPYNYSWTPGGQTIANVTGLTAGCYTVNISDNNGCTITASTCITSPPVLTATTTTTPANCGQTNGTATTTPTGGTGAYTYSWSTFPIQTTVTASNLSAATYTVTVTDANGCTVTASATVGNVAAETVTINPVVNDLCNGGNNGSATSNVVGGSTPYTYSWTTAPVQTTPTATGLTAGSYTLTVTDANGCIATASVSITQPPLLIVTTGAPVNILCNGGNNGSDLATATGGTGAYTYAWTPGTSTSANATSLSAATYTIKVTDANGCTASASVTITQPPALTITAAGFPVVCNGGASGQATVIPTGGSPAYTYSWSNGGTTANINNLTIGNYKITITDANGCSVDSTVTITQPAPMVVAFTADTVAGCAPLCTGFVNTSTDPGGVIIKWNWNFGDGGTDTLPNPRHCFATPGNYTVTLTVTDNHGCTSVLAIPNIINVYSFPVPSFTMSPQPTTITNPTITFTDGSTDAYGIASWLWNFNDPGNNVPSSLQNPLHNYSDTGTYCATLKVTNIHGCIDSVTECLVISPQYTLYVPNAFTPNGDGVDDIFMPKGQYVNNFEMYIFDRWGMLLYHTTDITKGWNGAIGNGTNICQVDTYVYLIKATDNQGNNHTYLGKVTLIK